MRRFPLIFFLFFGFFLLLLGGYMGAGWWVKTFGIVVKPSKAIPPIRTDYFLPNDSVRLSFPATSGRHDWNAYGCVCCVASAALNHIGQHTTPPEVNYRFDTAGIYNKHGEVIWKKIYRAYPGTGYYLKRVFTSPTLDEELLSGHLPIVKIKDHDQSEDMARWVLIVGARQGSYLVFDPLGSGHEPVPLSRFGNRVYAYQVLYRSR